MVPNESPYLKTIVLPPDHAQQVRILLLEVLPDLLQPLHSLLGLQVDLRLLKMVPNDSPYPKTWGLKKNHVPS